MPGGWDGPVLKEECHVAQLDGAVGAWQGGRVGVAHAGDSLAPAQSQWRSLAGGARGRCQQLTRLRQAGLHHLDALRGLAAQLRRAAGYSTPPREPGQRGLNERRPSLSTRSLRQVSTRTAQLLAAGSIPRRWRRRACRPSVGLTYTVVSCSTRLALACRANSANQDVEAVLPPGETMAVAAFVSGTPLMDSVTPAQGSRG